MNYGMYLSAAALRVGQLRMDVLANNMANVSTTSFKPDMTVVASRPTAPEATNLPANLTVPVLDDLAGGLLPNGVYTDFTQGNLITTDRPLDAAIQGEGFFSVDIDGEAHLTRDGRFDRSTDGYLVTAADGYRVLDNGGAPIELPAGPPTIAPDGTIAVGDWSAKLALTDVDNPRALRKVGDNCYAGGEQAGAKASTATVRHMCVEGSGVNPTRALVEMIETQRAFDASAKMMQFSDSMLGKAVNNIASLA